MSGRATLRAKEDWNTGPRFFEKARQSNFVHEIMYSLARWTRARWNAIAEKEAAFLRHIEDNLPILREALEDPRNDQPVIADLLLKAAPAVDMELTEEYAGFLRSVARRQATRVGAPSSDCPRRDNSAWHGPCGGRPCSLPPSRDNRPVQEVPQYGPAVRDLLHRRGR